MICDNELMHYGVLGMKWGVRRARRAGVDYAYRSSGQKKYQKKLDTQVSKGASTKKITKTQKKLDMFKTRDLMRQDYAAKTSLGKSIAKGILFGPIGSGSYSRLRSSGNGRLLSAGVAYLSNIGIGVLISKGAENATAKRVNNIKNK